MGFGIKPGFEETAEILKLSVSFAAPELMPLRFTVCAPAFSWSPRLVNAFNVGASLTGVTVTVKVWLTVLLVLCPSLTVTVTVGHRGVA